MMKISFLITFFILFHSGCQSDQETENAQVTQQRDQVRKDIQDWIDKVFSDNKKLRIAVEDLAKTPPESCEFKYKVECVEKIVGFDKALEIQFEMMSRVLNTPERQAQFDENIQKCKFGQGFNKQTCPHEQEGD
jgi:PBP1b-binding outer membrane lipoprotein LpoB